MKKNNLKKEHGITLIALSITIIVLIILAGITIRGIFGENGLIEQAKKTKNKTFNSVDKEYAQRDNMIQGYTNFITNPTIELEGEIQFGKKTWQNEEASIPISTDKSYKIQYQVNSIKGEWTTISSGDEVTGLKHEDIVYARLWDGENAGKYANAIILDEIAPIINNFRITKKERTSITVDVTAVDYESGIYSYEFQYKLSSSNEYITATTKITNSKTCTYKYEGLTENENYDLKVIVKDKASLTSEQTLNNILVQENNMPIIETAKCSSKTTNSMEITAKATDIDGDKLTYKLYISTSENGSYTLKATASDKDEGTEVKLNATGLSAYTIYWWYIEIDDGKEIMTSDKKSTRTYCPGTGYTCTTTYCSGTQETTCTICNGSGERRRSCSGGSTCSKCGGSGKIKCPGSPTEYDRTTTTCSNCGKNTSVRRYFRCDICGTSGYDAYHCSSCGDVADDNTNRHPNATIDCTSCGGSGEIECSHGYTSSHSYYTGCSTCDGIGKISTIPCIHGYATQHYYCKHYDTTAVTSHSYCIHGRTSQHDD